jgi:radical SAM-linked protein
MRLTYAKRGRARFISHLELIEVFDRACRRGRLPLAFSQGHRPAPRLRFSPGLPVGAESDCEVIDIDLSETLAPATVGERFGAHLPEGLHILAVEELTLRTPSPEHDLIGYRYRIDVSDLGLGSDRAAWIDERLRAFCASDAYPMRKRTGQGKADKTIDARPLVARLERIAATIIELDVRFSHAGSVKPTDLLAAILDLEPDAARALPLHKTHAFYGATLAGGAVTDAATAGAAL